MSTQAVYSALTAFYASGLEPEYATLFAIARGLCAPARARFLVLLKAGAA